MSGLRACRFGSWRRAVARLAARWPWRSALDPRAAGAPEIQAQRRTDQPQRFSKSRFDEADVMRRDAAFDVGEKSKAWRRVADLRHVHQVQAPPIDLRRIHRGRSLGQRAIQPRSLEDSAPRISRRNCRRDYPIDAVTRNRRCEYHRRVLEERVALVRVANERRHLAPTLRGDV